jgi:hypothetical protein
MGRKGRRFPVWSKILIGFVLFFMLATIAVSIYLSGLLNRRLREMVAESSHGLYKLDYRKVNVNALTGNLSIHDVELMPDTAVLSRLRHANESPRFLVGGKAEKLQLKNVRWLSYLINNKLIIGKLLIDQPHFNVTQYHQQKDSARKYRSIYELISKHVKDLRIGLFGIRDAVVNYQVTYADGQSRTMNKIEHLDIGFTRIHFDKEAGKPGLVADDYNIQLKDYRHRTTDSLYWIGVSGFDYNSRQKKLKLASFYVEPRFSDEEFSKRLKEQETKSKMKLENLVAHGFDMSLLAEEGKAIVPELHIGRGIVDIYMDRALPKPGADQVNAAISQKILNLGFPFTMQVMKLNNIQLMYREFQPLSARTAVIAFENVSGQGTNITTIPEHISRNALMKFTLNGRFLKAPINATFEFDLSKTDGTFKSWLKATQIEADQLNPILVPVAKIEARKGLVKELEATVHGTADLASADVNLMYEGLKINILKIEGDSMVKKGLPSMFANLFILDDNPKDGVLRTANDIVQKRGFGRSFFNMLWGSIAVGIQQIIAKKQGLKF